VRHLLKIRALPALLWSLWLGGSVLAQGEAEQAVPTIAASPWWIRWLALLGICAVVGAICFKNPKRGHDQ
jgi:hypothetical protein